MRRRSWHGLDSSRRRLRPASQRLNKASGSGTTAFRKNIWSKSARRCSLARPDYIARVHAAKYDLRFCSRSEQPQMLRPYRTALNDASRLSGYSEPELEAARARDFGEWMKQERLPKPPGPSK